MKLTAILILGTIVFSVFLPSTAHIPLSPAGQERCFAALDVCNSPGSFVPANADVPSLPEGHFGLLPVGFAGFMETGSSSFALTPFHSQIERPPRTS